MAVLKNKMDAETMTQTLKELNEYYAIMEEKYPAYYQSKFQMTIPSFSACQSLSKQKNKTFIQYHVSGTAIYFLAYGENPQFESTPLDSVFRKDFNMLKHFASKPPTFSRNEANTFARLSVNMYSKLFKPIKDPRNDLVIIPEGLLSQFPFEVLIPDTAGTFKTFPYLVKKFRFSYAHSLKIYSLPTPPGFTSGIKHILGYAYSEKNNVRKKNDLPGSAGDLQSLSTVFPESSLTFRMGSKAIKSQFLSDVQGPYNLIHVAMHASSSTSDRNSNKIEFASLGTGSNFLHAYELIPAKMKAHTVVLASCESASGTQITGEGTFNLERAFSQMGAATVISSAWQMPDQSGHKVIESFYRHLQSSSHEAAASLTRSKLDYLNHADEYTSHPFFWASLICIENQRGQD
jgi:CHAT domain-containing protein